MKLSLSVAGNSSLCAFVLLPLGLPKHSHEHKINTWQHPRLSLQQEQVTLGKELRRQHEATLSVRSKLTAQSQCQPASFVTQDHPLACGYFSHPRSFSLSYSSSPEFGEEDAVAESLHGRATGFPAKTARQAQQAGLKAACNRGRGRETAAHGSTAGADTAGGSNRQRQTAGWKNEGRLEKWDLLPLTCSIKLSW